jgi:hypothetical protein
MVMECIFEGEGGGRYDLVSVDLMLGIHMPVLVQNTSPRHVHKALRRHLLVIFHAQCGDCPGPFLYRQCNSHLASPVNQPDAADATFKFNFLSRLNPASSFSCRLAQ